MNKKIFITNGQGASGKDTFVNIVDRHIPVLKCSIIDIIKDAGEILGCDTSNVKTEKDRKFLSDLKDLVAEYNDLPYQDIKEIVDDFNDGYIEDCEVLFIDMRDPSDIKRAVKDFNAETILMRNPRNKKIDSNHADLNVENYNYDYIIENDGTIEQLEKVAKFFIRDVICNSSVPKENRPFVMTCSKY